MSNERIRPGMILPYIGSEGVKTLTFGKSYIAAEGSCDHNVITLDDRGHIRMYAPERFVTPDDLKNACRGGDLDAPRPWMKHIPQQENRILDPWSPSPSTQES